MIVAVIAAIAVLADLYAIAAMGGGLLNAASAVFCTLVGATCWKAG